MNDRAVVTHLLKEHLLTGYFDVVLSADDIQESKPNPQIFLQCSRKLRVPPKNCVVIEDSVFGVKAAKAAGMRYIAVGSGAYSEKELNSENPDLVVHSLREKAPILNYILNH